MRYFLATASLLASALMAQRVPETEPNNSAGQAQVVALGSQVDAFLTAGDEDWFQFTTTGGNVRVYAHGATATDTVFELYNSSGSTVLAVNDDSDAYFSRISLNVGAGTYLLRVTGWASFTTGSYQLEVGEVVTIAATGSESEPNGSLAQADNLVGGDVIDGSLSSSADQDWYRITLTSPRTGIWFLIEEGDAPWVSNHRYEIYDSGGVLLSPSSTYGVNAANSSSSEIRSSEVRSWPAGTYYLVIKNSTFPGGYGSLVPQGNYRLQLVTMPMGQTPISESEPNNTIQNATPVSYGSGALGTVTAGSDAVDIYGPFVVSGPTVMQFQTTQGASSPLLDSTMRLLADDGTPLSTWTYGNTLTSTSHARATALVSVTPATYYVEVASPGAAVSQSGSYVFEIGARAAPYAIASYSIAEVNSQCLGSNSLRPTITVDSPGERPVLGTNLSRTVRQLPPFAPFFTIEGLSDEIGNGSIPLPFDLGSLGAPNCFVHVDPVAVLLNFGNASGVVRLDSTQANSVVFRGMPIYEQAVALDPAANSLGLTASNYARRLLGER